MSITEKLRRNRANLSLAASMVILLLIGVAIHQTVGMHSLADFVIGVLFLGLIAAWVYRNNNVAALSKWEQQVLSTTSHEHPETDRN